MPDQEASIPIRFNLLYFKTFHAVAKLLETIFCFSAFISSLIATGSYSGTWSYFGAAYVDVISIIGAVVSLSIFILSLFNIWFKIPSKVRNLLETIFFWLWTIFLLAAAVVACQFSRLDSALMSAAVFCILAIIMYASDATVALMKLLIAFQISIEGGFGIVVTGTSIQTTTSAPANAAPYEARY